jgi:hypothetical protein
MEFSLFAVLIFAGMKQDDKPVAGRKKWLVVSHPLVQLELVLGKFTLTAYAIG